MKEVLFRRLRSLGFFFGAAANAATDSTVNACAFAASVTSSEATSFAVLTTLSADIRVEIRTVLLLVCCSSSHAASFSSSHLKTSQGRVTFVPPIGSWRIALSLWFRCVLQRMLYASGRSSPAPSTPLKHKTHTLLCYYSEIKKSFHAPHVRGNPLILFELCL